MKPKPISLGPVVSIVIDDIPTVHAEHFNGVYGSLCGLDDTDPDESVNHSIGPTPKPTAKITCSACCSIIEHCRQYKSSQLSKNRVTV